MSDKNKIILEDSGWSQMATILDRELPQKKHSKRLVLWFFISGLILLGSVFLFNLKDKTATNENNVSIAHKIEDLNKNVPHALIPVNEIHKGLNTTTLENNESNSSSIKRTSDGINAINKQDIIFSQQKNRTINSLESIDENSRRKVGLNVNDHESFKPSSLSANHEGNDMVITEVVSNIEFSLQNTILAEPFSRENPRGLINIKKIAVGGKIIRSEEKQNIDLIPINTPINTPNIMSLIKPSTKRNNFYVFAGANIGLNEKGTGYQLGIGKILGTKYFDFFVEGGYAHMSYKNKKSINESITIDFTPEIAASGSDFNVIESASFQNAVEQYQIYNASLVNNQNYVFLTAGIEKKLFKKLKILGGLTYSRFLKVENTEVNFTSANGTFQSSLDRFNISKTALYENGDFKKYEVSSKIGIGYLASPRLNISANYRMGLTDLIRNESSYIANDPNGEIFSTLSYKSIYSKNIEMRIDYSF